MKLASFTKSYSGKLVLDFPGAEIPDGKITAVIGPNGSGKSTMAKVVSGIEKPDRNTDVLLPGTSAAYLPQKSYAFRMSLEKNIMINGSDLELADRLMKRLGIADIKKQRAKKLSGGETAKMALARLLMGRYDLIILDEPTAAMDMESTLSAEELIRDYSSKTGSTVLLITHSISQARRLSDEIMFFCGGKLKEHGDTAGVLDRPSGEELRRFLSFF